MGKLIVGFDSAWTPGNSGALVGVFISNQGERKALGTPIRANFGLAENVILGWQHEYNPVSTLIMLDQPTIVENITGQRPVENVVSSPVSLRYGGVQPANKSRVGMFDESAPIWPFLRRFGGAADPRKVANSTASVVETYPVLTLIANGWLLEDIRPTGRLPKYNPQRKKTFDIKEWLFLCERVLHQMRHQGLELLEGWLEGIALHQRPGKTEQDQVDACICLLNGLQLVGNDKMLLVGELETGYMVVPWSDTLFEELASRCLGTNRNVSSFISELRWTG